MNFETVIAVILAYLIGSISSAVVVCKLFHLPDPRSQGSGNPGATNVLRFGGKKAAILTLIGDFAKGVIPVVLAKWAGIDVLGLALVTFMAFLGHLYPVFFQFKGGKGVATAFGALLALSLPVGGALLITWLTVAIVFRYSSLAALITAISAPIYTYFFTNPTYACVVTLMSALLIWRHRKNIRQLWLGTEDKIGQRSDKAQRG